MARRWFRSSRITAVMKQKVLQIFLVGRECLGVGDMERQFTQARTANQERMANDGRFLDMLPKLV